LPTALVTGAPERVPDIVIALKSAGFDILAAGVMSPEDAPDIEPGSVDCWVQIPVDGPSPDGPAPDGGTLRRTRAVIAHELAARFDTAARFLPLLAAGAAVVLVAEGPDPDPGSAAGRSSADPGSAAGRSSADPGSAGGRSSADPDQQARRALVGLLAEAIQRDCGRTGVRCSVIGEDRATDGIAALAAHRPPQAPPWWRYVDVDPDLDFADWRNSVLCLASQPEA
jgi:hypothetical protein